MGVDFYRIAASKVGHDYDAVYSALHYGTRLSQGIRFTVAAGVLDRCARECGLSVIRVMDYGCGVGDFCRIAESRAYAVDYVGVDCVEKFVDVGCTRYPGRDIRYVKDIVSLDDPVFDDKSDVVVANAVFCNPGSMDVDGYEEYVLNAVCQLYGLARYALCVDFFNDCMTDVRPRDFILPENRMIALARRNTDRYDLIRSYAPHVTTMVLYRPETYWKSSYQVANAGV